MKLNDWEGRPPYWLDRAFDEDAKDIVDYILPLRPVKIMEVGFGNNRLFKSLLSEGIPCACPYYGFDKTVTFVERAKEKFLGCGNFRVMDIEDRKVFLRVVENLEPDVLILRYILEHLPKWNEVLSWVNGETKVPKLLISLYVSAGERESRTSIEVGSDCEYTVNHISNSDIDGLLSLYELRVLREYPAATHTFRIYERKNV